MHSLLRAPLRSLRLPRKRCIFLIGTKNPKNVENGYYVETGWVTNNKNINLPSANTLWEIDGNEKLTPNSSVKLKWSNNNGIKFEKIISVLRLIPFGLGCLIIRSRHSETRKIALSLIEENLYNFAIKKIYPEISDSKLLGGIDFSETLRSGKPVYSKSIFDDNPKIFKLMMGERFEARVRSQNWCS